MQGNWKPDWLKKHAESLGPDQSGHYIALAMQFGLSLAISLFLMIRLGNWLDARLGTGFIFMVLGVLIAVTSSLFIMIRRILTEPAEKP